MIIFFKAERDLFSSKTVERSKTDPSLQPIDHNLPSPPERSGASCQEE